MNQSATRPTAGAAGAAAHPEIGQSLTTGEMFSRLAAVFLSTYTVLLLVVGPGQISDPFLHYDDYPALLLDPSGYYAKTLAEGRWFNYLWFFRGVVTPPWVNLQLYLLGWALFVAAAALTIFRSSGLRYTALFAAFAVLAPQTTLISGWFNTLIPGMWLMAAYSVAVLFVSPRTGTLLLVPFVPVAMQAYTPYPFLMLAICLMREDRNRSFAAFLGLLVTFVGAFALGLLVIFSINFFAHGVFGVALAEWRDPTPASGLTGYVANLPKLWASLTWTFLMTGYGHSALAAAIFGAFLVGLVFISLRSPLEALSILTGIAAGLALLSIHALQQGILFPFRSTYFLWFLIGVTILRAARLAGSGSGRTSSVPFAVALVLTLAAASFVRLHHASLAAWQVETRRIAAGIPVGTGTIYVYGAYIAPNANGDSYAQMPRDFSSRIQFLTGHETHMCTEPPWTCGTTLPPFDPSFGDGHLKIASTGGDTFIRLPVFEARD